MYNMVHLTLMKPENNITAAIVLFVILSSYQSILQELVSMDFIMNHELYQFIYAIVFTNFTIFKR